jgi:hypothetical protein
MTVGELKKKLALHDETLEVLVRCTWEGDQPPVNVFSPRTVQQDIDHDTAQDFVAIECDQDEDD